MHRTTLALTLAAFAVNAFAGDPDAAKAIVVQHCVKCHAVPDYNPEGGPVSLDAPSFLELANDRERYSEARLRSFLRSPHWPMTQFSLSASDIDNLIDYIGSLGEQGR